MKKTFAVILACMMLIFAFAGCGKKADTETSPAATEEVSEAPSEATTSEEPSEATTSEEPASEAPSAEASTSPAA